MCSEHPLGHNTVLLTHQVAEQVDIAISLSRREFPLCSKEFRRLTFQSAAGHNISVGYCWFWLV